MMQEAGFIVNHTTVCHHKFSSQRSLKIIECSQVSARYGFFNSLFIENSGHGLINLKGMVNTLPPLPDLSTYGQGISPTFNEVEFRGN